MAYAHVQSTATITGSAVATSSGSFSSTPTVGNLVVVGISSYRSATERSIVRVTDNQTASGNFYQEDVEDIYGTAESVTAIYSCKVKTASGTFTITITPTRHATADHYMAWGAAEFSGIGGANMPSFVGDVPGAVQSFSSASSGTISRTLAAGSIWVVCLSQSSSGSRSYTIATTGLTWSDVVDGTTMLAEGTTNNAEAHIWWAYDSAGGARTATVTLVSSTATFVLTDLEIAGLDTSTPGDKVDIEVEGATSTSHSHTALNTSANGGIGLVWATSESGNVDYTTPTENGGWSKMLGGSNANRYLMLLRRTNGALTSETGSHVGGTARQMNSIMVFFKAASAVTPWAHKNGTNESTTGDANVTASAANTVAGCLVAGVATVLNIDTDINIGDTVPTGSTQVSVYENASGIIGHSFVFKIVSATETSTFQWTHDNTSQSGWNGVIQTYRDDTGGTTLTLPTLTASPALNAPTITVGAVTLTLPTLAAAPSLFAPTITTGVTISLPFLTASPALFEPTITVGPVTLILPTLAASPVFNAPTISQGLVLSLPFLTASPSLNAPAITAGPVVLTLPTLGMGPTLNAPVITTGAVTLVLPTLTMTQSFFAPTVTVVPTSSQTLTLPFLQMTLTLYAPHTLWNVAEYSTERGRAGQEWYKCGSCGVHYPRKKVAVQNGIVRCRGVGTRRCWDEVGRDGYVRQRRIHAEMPDPPLRNVAEDL